MLPLVPLKRQADAEEDSDDSQIWEQVTDGQSVDGQSAQESVIYPPQIIITRGKKRSGVTKEQKLSRSRMHQVHLVALLAAVIIRNKWCNDGNQRILNDRYNSEHLLFNDYKTNRKK